MERERENEWTIIEDEETDVQSYPLTEIRFSFVIKSVRDTKSLSNAIGTLDKTIALMNP